MQFGRQADLTARISQLAASSDSRNSETFSSLWAFIQEGLEVGALVQLIRRILPGAARRRELRAWRITPEELNRRLQAGEPVATIDLRHPLDFLADPRIIPGATRMSPDELERRHQEIPRDREVVLYCTCPTEASSARTAQLLRRKGITRVRLLAGGFHAWKERRLPLTTVDEPALGTKAHNP